MKKIFLLACVLVTLFGSERFATAQELSYKQKVAIVNELIEAAKVGDIALLEKNKAYINDINYENYTPLAALAEQGEMKAVQALLGLGAKVDYTDEGLDDTPLMLAAGKGHSEVVRLLIQYGADVNCISYRGSTALMAASSGGYINTMQVLVENGADVNLHKPLLEPCEAWYGTALMNASRFGQVEAVKFLLANNANIYIEYPTGDHETALDFAKQSEHEDVVKVLENAINPKLKDDAYLISMVDSAAYEGLYDIKSSDMRVRERYTGAFSAPNKRELLVTFSSFKTTFMMLFDAQTAKPIAQDIIYGFVEYVVLLPTNKNTNIIYSISFMTQGGYYEYTHSELAVEGNSFVGVSVFAENEEINKLGRGDGSFFINYENNNVDLYKLSYGINRERQLEYVTTYVWNSAKNSFENIAGEKIKGLRGFDQSLIENFTGWLTADQRELVNAGIENVAVSHPSVKAWVEASYPNRKKKAPNIEVPTNDLPYIYQGIAFKDFYDDMLQIFTPAFFDVINRSNSEFPYAISVNDELWVTGKAYEPAHEYIKELDTYELISKTNYEIILARICYFVHSIDDIVQAKEKGVYPIPKSYYITTITLVDDDGTGNFRIAHMTMP